MSGSYGKALAIDFVPSRRMTGLLVIVHAGAVLCPALAGLPLPVVIPMAVAVAISFYATVHRYALLRGRLSVVRLVLGENMHTALFADGRVADVQLRPGSVNTRNAVVLPLAAKGEGRFYVPIVPDMTDPDTYRRLRVWLTVNSG